MNNNYFESYNKRTHVIGRISSAIALVMLVGAPFLIGRMLGAMPDIGAVGKAFLSVGLVWTVSSVVEFLVYTPMLGAGGGYLAFITGNLNRIWNIAVTINHGSALRENPGKTFSFVQVVSRNKQLHFIRRKRKCHTYPRPDLIMPILHRASPRSFCLGLMGCPCSS